MRSNLKPEKLLLAAACGSLFTNPGMAQITVNVEGVLDTFAGSMLRSGDADRTAKIDGGGLSTPWIGLRGREDVGGGMQANFVLAAYFRPDTGETGRFPGDTLYSRASNVGLSGSLGAVTLGRSMAPNTLPVLRFNPFGNSPNFSPLALHLNVPLLNASRWTNSLAGDTVWSNQIRYTTPAFKDLTVNLHYQFGEAVSSNKENVGADLLYMGSPLSMTAFVQRVEVNNPLDTSPGVVKTVGSLNATRQTAWFIGASYDFKRAKLFATYDETTHDIDLHDRTYSISATVPASQGEFMGTWARTRRSGAGIPERRRDTVSIGYSHYFSKQTSLYGIFMHDKISTFESGNSMGAGIQQKF